MKPNVCVIAAALLASLWLADRAEAGGQSGRSTARPVRRLQEAYGLLPAQVRVEIEKVLGGRPSLRRVRHSEIVDHGGLRYLLHSTAADDPNGPSAGFQSLPSPTDPDGKLSETRRFDAEGAPPDDSGRRPVLTVRTTRALHGGRLEEIDVRVMAGDIPFGPLMRAWTTRIHHDAAGRPAKAVTSTVDGVIHTQAL